MLGTLPEHEQLRFIEIRGVEHDWFLGFHRAYA